MGHFVAVPYGYAPLTVLGSPFLVEVHVSRHDHTSQFGEHRSPNGMARYILRAYNSGCLYCGALFDPNK